MIASQFLSVRGFKLQEAPLVYVCAVSGDWLLERTTPSWRIDDPQVGFQRIVRENRAREIALAVLDQRRAFPNAIVLATDAREFISSNGNLQIPADTKFLVVDGQHRLWAQKFSDFEADFACVIHMGLSEVEMAGLFVEINDNQKRVPSSLRWDLVRLVRPEDDPFGIAASEMVYLLATDEESPLFQRIDLTGEQHEIQLKQGSIAPELKRLLSTRSPIHRHSFDQQYSLIMQYFIAIRELDPDRWGAKESPFYKARVLRALLRLLTDLIRMIGKESDELIYSDFSPYLSRIDESLLDPESIRAAQGSAGIKAIYDQLRDQVLSI
jgi:DNA sulfur modification protein DndB